MTQDDTFFSYYKRDEEKLNWNANPATNVTPPPIQETKGKNRQSIPKYSQDHFFKLEMQRTKQTNILEILESYLVTI
jgi:hypothetical protein